MNTETTAITLEGASPPLRWSGIFSLGELLSLSAILWIMLWLSINTGPWVLTRTPSTPLGWLHYLRTILPIFVLLASLMFLQSRQDSKVSVISGPVKLWLAYGLIGLAACVISSPRPYSALYWALCYLSVFSVANFFIQGPNPIQRAVALNYLSWLITAVFLAILLFAARDALFVDSRTGLTGYGIVTRVGSVADMAMSRSSGLARFAAVPGVVCFVLFWQSRGLLRLLWAGVVLGSGALIYLMQSRGAILGFAFAIFFVMLFMGVNTRRIGLIFLIVLGVIVYADVIPDREIEHVSEHVLRGQEFEELKTMTGRTRAWEKGWKKMPESPVWGWGPQADRYLIKEHVHNTYMYALMSAGFAGTAAFVGGLAWAWIIFLRSMRRGIADRYGQRAFLIQAGGVLAFFTVRSIPEVCGAMFGVDFMVMLPVLAYLTLLDQKGKEEAAPSAAD